MSDSHTYIYGLEDPLNGKIFYVGKSDNPKRRLTQHLNVGKSRTKKAKVIKALKRNNLKPRLVILETVQKTRWEGAEKKWIKELRRSGHPLTNVAPGGVYVPKSKRTRKSVKGKPGSKKFFR